MFGEGLKQKTILKAILKLKHANYYVIMLLKQKKLPKFCNQACKCYIAKNFDISFIKYKINGNNTIIITDKTIFDNLFYQVFESIDKDKIIILPSGVKPYKTLCTRLAKQILDSNSKIDTIVAIGSGTINDIAKYTSFFLKINYIIIPSALSMNGYTSSNASLIFNGLKQSFSAHLPKKCIFCLDILSQAPKYLTNSGILDCLATIPAHFDWLLSSISQPSIKYKNTYLKSTLPSLKNIINNNADIKNLIKAIILSGFAMTNQHSSTPASGSEHILAHVCEMLFKKQVKHLTHGQLVGVFLKDILYLQRKILDKSSIQTKVIHKNDIKKHFNLSNAKTDDIINLKSNLKVKITQLHKAKLVEIMQHCDKILNTIEKLSIRTPLNKNQQDILYKISHLSRDRLSVLDVLQ